MGTRRGLRRLSARLAQLPNRAPPLARPVDALVPKGGATRTRPLRQARRAVRAGVSLAPTQKDDLHHRGAHIDAPLSGRIQPAAGHGRVRAREVSSSCTELTRQRFTDAEFLERPYSARESEISEKQPETRAVAAPLSA